MKKLIYAILLTLLSACSSVSRTPVVNQAMPKVTYEGRGSAAGPMLAGALGPVGIAVGFAIDEGIGKDIGLAMDKSKEQGMWAMANAVAQQHPDVVTVAIQKVAFKAQRGDDDLAFARVELNLESAKEEKSLCFKTEPGNLSELKETSLGWQLITKAIIARDFCTQ
ncbi:hypothetical protein [Pseudoalteromonas rubra]|uniref:Lipoprotein n=1 Tax=Pseudoalteromonas rubra TaxID=43658 RepID=A0A0F4QZC3_9GAMM|nr:hypothetical protein [Pseudoalteromonas rubra]KJZ12699.1 hypothetical protein TW77_02685 [Pseudoalteromonas rubra]